MHKTANVLNKLPKSVQPRAKQHLQDIWMAETRAVAEKAFDFFLEAYGPKYDKAVACLAKDRDVYPDRINPLARPWRAFCRWRAGGGAWGLANPRVLRGRPTQACGVERNMAAERC